MPIADNFAHPVNSILKGSFLYGETYLMHECHVMFTIPFMLHFFLLYLHFLFLVMIELFPIMLLLDFLYFFHQSEIDVASLIIRLVFMVKLISVKKQCCSGIFSSILYCLFTYFCERKACAKRMKSILLIFWPL